MDAPKLYTVYKRIAPLSIAIYWVLWLLLIIWFADITEAYPDLNDFLGVLLIINVIWGPFFLGQLVSRFKCIVTVKADAIVHIDAVSRHSLVRDDHPVVMLKDVNEISTGHDLFAGNYIALRFRYGHVTRLYSKRYMFSKNPEFFDLYVALKNAWNGIEETEKGKIRTAHEWEGSVGVAPLHEYTPVSIPVSPEPTHAPATPTPVPQPAAGVRSAVRSDNVVKPQPQTLQKKTDTGNGITIAAVIFCLFLLGMASLISSYEVPAGLDGVRDTLYTMLIIIALILGGIIVASFVGRHKQSGK
ncbi:MAG: hypothetical protein KF744_02880 [Taibaiella sp.]|nr:hypothetical protein [Taibaiella sp.]